MSLPKALLRAVNTAEPLRLKRTDYGFVPQLDADHEKLFEDLERVRQSMSVWDTTSEIAFTTWRLSRSLSVHLASEERMMRQVRYPAFRWHERQHDTGRKRMAELSGALNSDEAEITTKLDALAKWLTDHVALADRMLAAHLRNNRRESLVS